jgi:hypothetical protein
MIVLFDGILMELFVEVQVLLSIKKDVPKAINASFK